MFWGDAQPTYSAAQLAKRTGVGTVGLAVGLAGLVLLRAATWEEVLSGALIAWAQQS